MHFIMRHLIIKRYIKPPNFYQMVHSIVMTNKFFGTNIIMIF